MPIDNILVNIFMDKYKPFFYTDINYNKNILFFLVLSRSPCESLAGRLSRLRGRKWTVHAGQEYVQLPTPIECPAKCSTKPSIVS